MPAITITVLGSGTSMGVPTLGCDCKVCTSPDPRDNRLRPSVMVQFDGRTVLIDTTPDFRQQALRARILRIDAILYTHAHADHIMGLDDVRPINLKQKGHIPIYGSPETLATGLTEGPPAREHTEQDMRAAWFDRREVSGMIRDGEITDAQSIAAYALLLLSGR